MKTSNTPNFSNGQTDGEAGTVKVKSIEETKIREEKVSQYLLIQMMTVLCCRSRYPVCGLQVVLKEMRRNSPNKTTRLATKNSTEGNIKQTQIDLMIVSKSLILKSAIHPGRTRVRTSTKYEDRKTPPEVNNPVVENLSIWGKQMIFFVDEQSRLYYHSI